MKNILKLSLIALLVIFTTTNTFAGSSWNKEIEHTYNGNLDNYAVGEDIQLKGYINPHSIGFSDNGFGGINIKNLDLFKQAEDYYKINDNVSFGIFFPENEIETISTTRNDGSIFHSRGFKDNFNEGIPLYGTKNFIESLNYYDSTYTEYDHSKSYINGSLITNSNYTNINGGLSPKSKIVEAVGGNSQISEANVIIEGKIKEINIDEDVYFCKAFSVSRDGEIVKSNQLATCKSLTSELKRDFLKGKINTDHFEQIFKNTWESNFTKNITIKTKIFLLDKIVIDKVTYGAKAPVYTLSSKYKKQLDSFVEKIASFSESKQENIHNKLSRLLDTQRYGRKNYVIFDYIKNGMDNYYSNDKKIEAQIILDNIKSDYEESEDLNDEILRMLFSQFQ